MGSENHYETTKSLHICYLFNINLSYKDLKQRIISEWAALSYTVFDSAAREWRQRL